MIAGEAAAVSRLEVSGRGAAGVVGQPLVALLVVLSAATAAADTDAAAVRRKLPQFVAGANLSGFVAGKPAVGAGSSTAVLVLLFARRFAAGLPGFKQPSEANETFMMPRRLHVAAGCWAALLQL
jgi:hypothetical protein